MEIIKESVVINQFDTKIDFKIESKENYSITKTGKEKYYTDNLELNIYSKSDGFINTILNFYIITPKDLKNLSDVFLKMSIILENEVKNRKVEYIPKKEELTV